MQDLFGKEEEVDNFEDFDSNEEYYFWKWIEEAKEAGYISDVIWQPKPFRIFESMTFDFERHLKTKSVTKSKELLKGQIYTADYYIIWSDSARGTLFYPIDGGVEEYEMSAYFKAQKMKTQNNYFSYGDVKGTHNSHGGDRIMSMIQKLIWSEFGMYINKTIVTSNTGNSVFRETWTPHRFTLSDKKKTIRKIHYPVINISEFTKSKIKVTDM